MATKRVTQYEKGYQTAYAQAELILNERLTQLEFALENQGWERIDAQLEQQFFSRDGLGRLVSLARFMFIKNPLVGRGVKVQADYVFGQGVDFVAGHPRIQEVVDEFLNDPENQMELTSHPAMIAKEWELQVSGNIYLLLFVNQNNGYIRVRSLPFEEVKDIITHPEDRRKILGYLREFMVGNKTIRYVYPAMGITKEDTYIIPPGRVPADATWQYDIPLFCIKSDLNQLFSIPEIYSALDWAKAYKGFLEDWTTIIKAYAKLAFKIANLKGQKQIGAARSKLESTVGANSPIDRNTPGEAGGTFLGAGNVSVEAVKTAGATTPAEDGKPVQLMVAAGMGLPNTFFGDANQGNFATAKTLDRPTELKMLSRQKLWSFYLATLLKYVIEWSVKAPKGKLRLMGGRMERQRDPGTWEFIRVPIMPNNDDSNYGEEGKPMSSEVKVKFPSILERNVTDRIRAIVNTVTLFGKPLHNIIPNKRLIASWLLDALGITDAQKQLDLLYPEGSDTLITEPEAEKLAKMGKPKPGGGGAEDPGGNG